MLGNSPSGMGYRPSEDDDKNQSGEKHGDDYLHHCIPEMPTQVVVPVHVAIDLSPATSPANSRRVEFRQSLLVVLC